MRRLDHLEEFRFIHPALGPGDEYNGAFKIRIPGSRLEFNVIASNGEGWDHVSVSASERCPKWSEMQHVKELFFEDHEVVIQIHPAASDYVNVHPNCLHLWRPTDREIPTPPIYMV